MCSRVTVAAAVAYAIAKHQKGSLSFLETLNLKIIRAYLLKESFRDFYQSLAKEVARKFMEQ